MNVRLLPQVNTRVNTRVIAVALLALGALLFAAAPHGGRTPTAVATHQGAIGLSPSSQPILQGHKTSIPVQMATCASTTGSFSNVCRIGAYNVKMGYDTTRLLLITDLGTATSATATTITDTTKNWTPNQWVGTKVVLRSGTGAVGGDGAPQARIVTANTATTLTAHVGWDGVSLPNSTTKYVVGGAGISSVTNNTSTTLRDFYYTWKVNQWAGTRITLLGGSGYTGSDGNPQSRIVVSNTLDTFTVSPPWDTAGGIPLPNNTTRYMVGGMSNGAFLGSTGRSIVCAADPVIAGGFAELGCITLGNGPPWGANGTGILTTLTVQALSSAVGTQPCGGPNPGTWVPCFPRGITSVPLVSPNTQVLRIDGVDIAADVVSGSRRVMICPDANPTPDNLISAVDLSLIAQQFLKKPGDVGYTLTRDPDENGVINAIDLSQTAQVFGKRCTQL